MAVRDLRFVPSPAWSPGPGTIVGLVAVLVALAVLLPAAYLGIRALEHPGASWDEISRSTTIDAAVRTLLLALAVAGAATLLAVPIAWLTARTDLPFGRAWFVLLALPLTIPSYIGAFTFRAALGPRGMLRDLLAPFGVDELPTLDGFVGAWLVLTLFTYPYILLPARAAVRGIDRSLEEAARSLGKSALSTFLRVTVPQMRPAVAAGALLVALYALSDFGAVSLMRFDSLSRIMYVHYRASFDRASASSIALLLVAIALVVVTLESLSRGRSRYHSGATARPAARVRLGWWRWPAVAFCGLVALFALVVPLGVLVYWLVRGLNSGEAVGGAGGALLNSFYASLLAGGVAAVAALPVAYLAARRPGIGSGLIEKLSYTGFALPGITVALALVFFGARYVPAVYQTVALLVFAYVVLFLPQAVGACRSAFLRINPRTEEASRSLGKSGPATFLRVTLPQLAPGISAAAALVFLTAMKELPATLLLSPIGFDTLAVQVWATSNEAFFARAAFPALLLVLVSSIPMLFLVLRERRIA